MNSLRGLWAISALLVSSAALAQSIQLSGTNPMMMNQGMVQQQLPGQAMGYPVQGQMYPNAAMNNGYMNPALNSPYQPGMYANNPSINSGLPMLGERNDSAAVMTFCNCFAQNGLQGPCGKVPQGMTDPAAVQNTGTHSSR
ncbi:MAG: hypothetical protein JST16_07390 [Bdellovibrionales bacterium]|nr:hypothetical protein [Bdellovibrionales bacterium]